MLHQDNGIETFTSYKFEKQLNGYIGVYGYYTPAGRITYACDIVRTTKQDALLDAEMGRQEILKETINLIP